VLMGVAAALLTVGLAGVPLAAVPRPGSVDSAGVSVTMTAQNLGRAVSLLDPAHPAWAHLAPTGAVTEVTATVNLGGIPIHEWVAHLDTPDAFQGVTPDECRGNEEAPPQQVSCHFAVQAASGINRLQFHFSADHGRVEVEAEGAITGGQFDWDAGWEVLDASGHWSTIIREQPVLLPATMTSALRYVVTNTGDIPFRVSNGCDHRVIAARAELVCLQRGVKSAQSLARDYHELRRLEDAVGATAEPDILASIRSFAGVFSLTTPGAVVGQDVVVNASGLPGGSAFALQYRLDDEPVLVGTTATTAGHARFTFSVPPIPPGAAHLLIIHNGVAIASLPLDVTTVPRPADEGPPAWLLPAGVVVAVCVPAAAVLLLLGLRRHRRRRSAPA